MALSASSIVAISTAATPSVGSFGRIRMSRPNRSECGEEIRELWFTERRETFDVLNSLSCSIHHGALCEGNFHEVTA